MADKERFGPPPDCAIFSDTGWEPESIYEWLEKLMTLTTIPIHVVSTGNLEKDILAAMEPDSGVGVGRVGQPPFYVKNPDRPDQADEGGMLWRCCTRDYKINPIQKKIRELLGYKSRQRVKKKCRQWFGISAEEAQRMKDSRVAWIDNFYPLVDNAIRREDCVKFLLDEGLPTPRKSACIACPYHSNAFWAKMKRDYPEEWDLAVEFDKKLRAPGKKLPGVRGDAFVHRRMKPLDEAVLDHEQPDQYNLWEMGGECEGLCGL